MGNLKHWLSPTGLNLFRECPRCFWLDRNQKIARPRGIFPSLPGGIDLILKNHYDQYRGMLPPELDGKVTGVLYPNQERLTKWRHWKSGLKVEGDHWTLSGALDDLIQEADLRHTVTDYKTKGSAPKEGDSEKYYGGQMDAYDLMLNKNSLPSSGKAHLIYYYPKDASFENGNPVFRFEAQVVTLQASADRALETINAAVACLDGSMPPSHAQCEHCLWLEERVNCKEVA